MFSNPNAQQSKLMSYLPNRSSMMSLEEYNMYAKQMLSVQSDKDGVALPQKEEVEKNHRSVVSSSIKSHIANMKRGRAARAKDEK